ncbi:hypothetical protein NPIL_92741 [Nephila pilipes]|uniref:Uncharacterized protein n=1 Tax=Nephila pilipes TaxID=299642 RepID=A0A8X6P8Q7_NEPPI|nr:hypothetical protein NPIL_92741 [Nephila pilipes]
MMYLLMLFKVIILHIPESNRFINCNEEFPYPELGSFSLSDKRVLNSTQWIVSQKSHDSAMACSKCDGDNRTRGRCAEVRLAYGINAYLLSRLENHEQTVESVDKTNSSKLIDKIFLKKYQIKPY